MTVYVDSANIPAQVGGTSSRWSHLTADTLDELNEFAARLGLQPAWLQTCKRQCSPPGEPCPHWHYDVASKVRVKALNMGAKPIDMRDLGRLIAARRTAYRIDVILANPDPAAVEELITKIVHDRLLHVGHTQAQINDAAVGAGPVVDELAATTETVRFGLEYLLPPVTAMRTRLTEVEQQLAAARDHARQKETEAAAANTTRDTAATMLAEAVGVMLQVGSTGLDLQKRGSDTIPGYREATP